MFLNQIKIHELQSEFGYQLAFLFGRDAYCSIKLFVSDDMKQIATRFRKLADELEEYGEKLAREKGENE